MIVESEVLTLRESGEELTACSPIVADIQLLWSIISKAAVKGWASNEHDLDTCIEIVRDGINKLDIHEYIEGGMEETLRITETLTKRRDTIRMKQRKLTPIVGASS